MSTKKRTRRSARGVALSSIGSLGLLMAASAVQASSSYITAWSNLYPSSSSENVASCALCHASSTSYLNPYGRALALCQQSGTTNERILAVEDQDSDADPTGSDNITEINANAQPGWTTTAVRIYNRSSCSWIGTTQTAPFTGLLDPAAAACNIAVSPTTLAFGTVTRPSSSTLTTLVSNTGNADCTVNLVKTGSADFAITSATSFSLVPNASSTVSVSYTPSDTGPDSGDIAVESEAPTVNVALSGTGVTPTEICFDGVDNDLDSLADCADPDCDGEIDGTCDTGQTGVCAAGTWTCQTPNEVCVRDTDPVNEQPEGSDICEDNLDNDCDGATDEQDSGCQPPPAESDCFDGIDNNGDGTVDCEDPTCANAISPEETSCGIGECAATGNWVCENLTEVDTCTPGTPVDEDQASGNCDDGLDNNCNTLVDMDDPTCAPESDCFDGIDNNGDGNIDCADPTCANVVGDPTSCGTGICAASGYWTCVNGVETDTCQEGTAGTEGPWDDPTCEDNLDNDCDGATDAQDPDCVGDEVLCFDGEDNNGDGTIDCADPTCADVTAPSSCGIGVCASTGVLSCSGDQVVDSCQPGAAGTEGPPGDPTCSDGEDNDCDGDTDANDTDCLGPEVCDNGLDDDYDTLVDCADPDCANFQGDACQTGLPGVCADGTEFCREGQLVCESDQEPSSESVDAGTCNDGIDNDCDGLTDADDPSCDVPEDNCFDGVDNNGDGTIDCADPTCANVTGPATSCGIGVCAASGNLVCFNGEETDTCEPGTADIEGPPDDATCTDGVDNDCDGATDDYDMDCQPEICDNGQDDNGNGLVDCEDPLCDDFVGEPTSCGVGACEATGNLVCQDGTEVDTCTEGTPSSESFDAGNCNDGIDNDCDGLTDAEDPGCEVPPEVCDNQIDDDLNGLTDCEDGQCDGVTFGACDTGVPGICAAGTLTCDGSAVGPVCVQDEPAGTEGPFGDATCSDGLDNDCDGLADADDADCQPEICDNGQDDNDNGLVDCEDPLCADFVGVPTTCGVGACEATGNLVCQDGTEVDTCTEGTPSSESFDAGTCTDGIDNDCDGLTDAEDPGCEVPPEVCDNQIDDDLNGLTDCEDGQCDGATFGDCDTGVPGICSAGTLTCDGSAVGPVCVQDEPAGTEGPFGDATCSDGVDNDCDGLTDADDADCQPEICDNGQDDNDNGLVDCEDPLCADFVGAPTTCGVGACEATGNLVCQDGTEVDTCTEGTPSSESFDAGTCNDGIDNDCNGLTDAEDPGCEVPPEVCDNQIDDDLNGLTDCEDGQCEGATFGACDTGVPGICAAGTLTCDGSAVGPVCVQDEPAGTEGPFGDATCSDGVDNDCDGLTDYPEDPSCRDDADVYLSNLQVPNNVNGRVGEEGHERRVRATGDGTMLTQEATATLTAVASPGIEVDIGPASVEELVVPGNPATRFIWANVVISCSAPGEGTVEWTATISAAGNYDLGNDYQTGTTTVTCR